MGESSASQVIKEASSQSGTGSVEENDNGHDRDLSEELEKLQVVSLLVSTFTFSANV